MKKHWILITAIVLFIIGLLVNMFYSSSLSSGEFAFNYFSAGRFSVGVFSAGIFSIGIFSAGIFSIGIFSIGIFNIGLYAIGIFILAYKKRLPKLFFSEGTIRETSKLS